jgi:hypothetical protein
VSAAWKGKWALLRLAVAAFLLYAVASDTGARLARLQYAALPDFDYAAEVAYLRAMGRYGEAVMVADAGLSATAPGKTYEAIQRERDETVHEQSSYLRRVRDLGMGALSGRGTSLESLIGAVAADFFVVGDVRDLVIQSGRYVLDGETDKVILVLSGVGLATTLAPEVDWVPAVIKAAKKAGALSRALGDSIVAMAKAGKRERLATLMRDVRRIAERASPGAAARLLRHADTPEDVARLARFVETQKAGAFALHITGKEGADLLKSAGRIDRAALAAADAERAVVLAARKGSAGVGWLRTGAYRAMLRPHWLVGVGKAFYKGNAEDLARRVAAELDPRAWWIVPLLAAWVFLELGLLARRWLPAARPVAQLRPA